VADPADIDDLQLLTTAHDFAARPPLTTFGDTSAAAALAARFAAVVWAKFVHVDKKQPYIHACSRPARRAAFAG
jgi:hypothetical protein